MSIIDMHCHLLPGIDDGARDMADAITALHAAADQGVRKIIMTPHFYPDDPITPAQVQQLTFEINQAAQQENINITIYPGMECMYFGELPKMLDKGEALTLAGSKYVLIEFQPDVPFAQLEKGMENVFDAGYIPILAHYHRYQCLIKKDRLYQLKRNGFLLQMNYDVIQRRYGLFAKNPFYEDLKNGIVDFLGSDCHGSQYRKYSLGPSVHWLEKNVTEERFYDMTYGNSEIILDDVQHMNIGFKVKSDGE